MKSKLTKETIHQLWVLLLLVLLTFYIFDKNATNKKAEELASDLADAKNEFQSASTKLVRRNAAMSELEKLSELPPENITIIPTYDNLSELMSRFSDIFKTVEPVLNFDDIIWDGNIAIRTIHFSFTADSYEEARLILTQLTGTGWRYTLDSLKLTALTDTCVNTGPESVSGTIRFYETVADN